MSNYTTVAALSFDLVERLAKECSAASASTVPGQPWVIGKKDLFLLLNRVHAMGRSNSGSIGISVPSVHPGYLIQVSPACLNLYLTARSDEDDEAGNLPSRTRDVRQALWYAEKKHAEQAMGHAVKEWPKAEFRVVDLPPVPPGGY